MDVTAIHWISLGLVAGLLALAVWSLADSTKTESNKGLDASEETHLSVLVCRPGKEPERVRLASETLIGRSRACHIVFDDVTVSKEHARMRLDGAVVLIEDLHSTNGTLVNGKAIDGLTVLRRGDRIGFGPNVIVLVGERDKSNGSRGHH